ncbi:hypothetical protein EDD27_2585 [Nonomuraea polychroma]|uniref:Transposase n=1 Tax=Nonomuraea polychroma TaxID=46176 RepID=A0A438M3L3_9ACTN|nr:hypothetical protein [Nonomuraea polychroma]RVX40187.1 hypothetical protein EDD27_2585 [Nonomuraea polychroma]
MAVRRSTTKRHGLPSVVQLRLMPTQSQADALAAAVQAGNQAAARAIARVAGAYANRRAAKTRAHVFRPYGAVSYDARLMSRNRDARTVSLWTPTGRVTVPCSGRPEDLKAVDTLPLGEADLVCRRRVWPLQVAVTLPKPAVREPVNGFLGVDQGVADLAVTNDGAVLPGPALPGPIHGNGHMRARGRFACTWCGLAGHAGHIAARNVAARGVAGWAVVNQPHATGLPSARRNRESNPPATAVGS